MHLNSNQIMVLRSIIFNFIFYFSIFFFGILFLPFLVSKKMTRLAVRIWAYLIIFFLESIVGARIIFKNNHINKKKGYLIAANHQSTFDTIFFLKQFDKVVYVVKKELKFIPIYGWYAMRLGNIFVDRKERIKSIKNLSKEVNIALQKNYKVIIFPEGTRQPYNKIGKMKPGIFALQKFSKSLVFPIYINSNLVWPKNTYIKKNKNIKVKTLNPIKCYIDKEVFLLKLEDSLKTEHKKSKINEFFL